MFVDKEKCEGCGGCVEVCPLGAAYFVAGKAVIDPDICDPRLAAAVERRLERSAASPSQPRRG